MSDTASGRARSAQWFDRQDIGGFIHRAFMKGSGFTPEDMSRPVIGIAQTWSELNHCNSHLRTVAEAVKRGVWQAGGWPMEFPTISLGEIMVKPTTMLYRNLMAIHTEELLLQANLPVDGFKCPHTIEMQFYSGSQALQDLFQLLLLFTKVPIG
jgi:dihydroxyacid dehydratase/phosphogluconate dehydratase